MWAGAIMANGAAVATALQKCNLHSGSSAAAEGLAMLKVSDKVLYARIVMARMGQPPTAPTPIMSAART